MLSARKTSYEQIQCVETRYSIISYHLEPSASLSVNTWGPLSDNKNGFSFVVVKMDNFSKFVGLYPARRSMSKYFIRALISIFGYPRKLGPIVVAVYVQVF